MKDAEYHLFPEYGSSPAESSLPAHESQYSFEYGERPADEYSEELHGADSLEASDASAEKKDTAVRQRRTICRMSTKT